MIKRRYCLELPHLSGEQAYLLALVLEDTVKAIWGVHGDAMADFQGRAFPDEPSPYGSVTGSASTESEPEFQF
jgi:hypothetical protein